MRNRRSTAGSVYVETLIAILVPFFFFFIIWQLADLLTAQLIVKHAAVAAARAAIVVGPDDERFYEGEEPNQFEENGVRFRDVTTAAALILAASPHFHPPSPEVKLSGKFGPEGQLTATVTAEYHCLSGWLNVACRGKESIPLSGTAVLPYQGADYEYR